MPKFATGKNALAISDRSGMAFPHNEMVKEWNGSLVHYSEFEPKHPQIRRRRTVADAIALQNTRPQRFQHLLIEMVFKQIQVEHPLVLLI